MNDNGELYLIAAPSGAGKTSLMKALLEHNDHLALSISDTTRPSRRGEVEGEQYHFVDTDSFQRGVEDGQYMEHAEVYGNFYGTRRDRVEALWQSGRDVLLEIDVQGAEQVRRHFPEVCSIFILPPSIEALRQRLAHRGSDEPEVIERRLGEARREIEACGHFRWMVVNDDFDQALAELQAIVTAWPLRRERQKSRLSGLLDESVRRSTIGD